MGEQEQLEKLLLNDQIVKDLKLLIKSNIQNGTKTIKIKKLQKIVEAKFHG